MPIVSRFNLPAQIDNLLLKPDLADSYLTLLSVCLG